MAKGPAVAGYALLRLLILALAVSTLFQVSGCSRPPPVEEPRATAVPHPALRDDPLRRERGAAADTEGATRPAGAEAEGAAAGTAAPSATASARDKQVGHPDDGAGSSNWGGALMTTRPPVVLPRRFLSEAPPAEGGADSAARSSCHSSDVHINCGPPSHS